MSNNPIDQIKNVINNVVNNKMLNKNVKNISTNDLQTNSGEILEIDGVKTAVFKDSSGNITKLDPKCTHMGCDIEWNKNSNVWDCPCHGSSFEPTGEVIKGPATKPLTKK